MTRSIALADIDAIYASANGTKRGDRLEMRAIQRLFGDDVPPVVATKGYFGEYAAGGGLQLAAALLAMRDQKLHASFGFEEADPEMRFTPVRESRAGEAAAHPRQLDLGRRRHRLRGRSRGRRA